MKIETWTICKNCGAEYGLHHYQTGQCPVGGREAPLGQKEEWKSTTFEADVSSDLLREEILQAVTRALNSCGSMINPEWLMSFIDPVIKDYL